jgi:UDP-N-acetylmuramoyl-tripeptide--D-alanyl-D-alanine ligase
MIALSLAEVAALTGGTVIPGGDADAARGAARGAVVSGPVVIDSRKAVPGALFVAVAGEHADGHDFAAGAADRGAVAALAARPVEGVPCVVVPDVMAALALLARGVLARLPGLAVTGITGSSGKTSTKDITAQLLERLGPTVSPEASLNNELGVPLTVLRASEQTRFLVLEMAARGPGHIGFLCDIAPPRIGAVLNVGRAHAGEFGSLETVAKAKGELVEALPAASAGGVAVLNADDPRVLAMADRTDARVVTFSAAPRTRAGVPAADVRAAEVTLDDLGRASFRLVMPGGMAPVRLRLHGAHHVPNSLAAAAIAAELGMEVPAIADALSAATARSGKRMEVRERPDGVLVINDAYNANPDSMRAGIEALGHMISRGRRGIAVLGHMAELGGIDHESHAEAGRLAARAGVATLIAVGESADAMLSGARSEAGWAGEAIAVPGPAPAMAALRNHMHPNDVVLVKASKAARLWEVADGLLTEVDR